jgi:PKD domain-containing protein
MNLYSSRSYQERKQLRPIQRTLKATATLFLFAFLPLTKDVALADVVNNSSPAVADEPRALPKGHVVPPSRPQAQINPHRPEVTQGQKATFTSDSVTDKHERNNQTATKPIVRQGTPYNRNTNDVGSVKSRNPVATMNPSRQNVKQGDALPGTLDGPGGVVSRGPVTKNNPGRRYVKQGDTPPRTSYGPSDVESRGPIARINPEKKRVPQGEIVHFVSVSRHPDPKGRIIRQSWTTQWGQTALGKTLDVDTRQLLPGLYHLVLQVADQREYSDTYTATLVVVNRPNPPRPPDIWNPGPPQLDPPQPPVVRYPPLPTQPPIAATTPSPSNYNNTNNAAPGATVGPSQAVVTISPNPLEVNRGAKAQFGSNTTATATPVVVERPPEVWLTTETQDPDVGQTVKFTGGTKPSFADTQYKFFFGDATETNWSAIPEATHTYEEPKSYTARIVARRAGVTIGQTSTGVTVKETPYSVTLTSDHENARRGDAVTFTAHVEPPLGDVEYQFRFSDTAAREWTRAATTTHSFSRDGTYAATVAIRIRGTRIVESPATHIRVSAPPYLVWLWVAALGVALIAAATMAYIKLLRVNFSVVPNTDLASLTVATSAKIDSDCSIGVRAARGEYKCMIQVDGALVRS